METLLGLFSAWTSSFQGLFIIALLGSLIVPDLPSTIKSSIYTQEQLDIFQKHIGSLGRNRPAKFTTKEEAQVAL
jgi:hypothetical protein